jgi:hypothetical protein
MEIGAYCAQAAIQQAAVQCVAAAQSHAIAAMFLQRHGAGIGLVLGMEPAGIAVLGIQLQAVIPAIPHAAITSEHTAREPIRLAHVHLIRAAFA